MAAILKEIGLRLLLAIAAILIGASIWAFGFSFDVILKINILTYIFGGLGVITTAYLVYIWSIK